MWTDIVVVVDGIAHRGRFRALGSTVELQWRGGRCVERLGAVKPEFVAIDCLRRCVLSSRARTGGLGPSLGGQVG
jgi:hypothetical protein